MYLAAGTVFKDETPYLREWVEYHRQVGIEHFHMLCNDPDPAPAREELRPYIETGIVTFEPYENQPKLQKRGFGRIFKALRERARWIVFIDLDEFVFARKKESLSDLFSQYDRDPIGGLVIHWKVFHSSGYEEHPIGKLQIETYVRRLSDKSRFHMCVKTAIRTHAADRPTGSHAWWYKPGFYPVNEHGEALAESAHMYPKPTFEQVQVNHYITRSRRDYARKIARGWPPGGGLDVSASARWHLWDEYHVENVFDDELSKAFSSKVALVLKRLRGRNYGPVFSATVMGKMR